MHPSHDPDDQDRGGIPDIAGRTWRHPSEVAADQAATSSDNNARIEALKPPIRQPYMVGAVLAAAMCTAGLVVAGLLQPGTMLSNGPGAPSVGAEIEFSSEHTLAAALQPGPIDAENGFLLGTGVFSASGEGAEFVSRFLVVDGALLTSAAALDGRTEVSLRVQKSPAHGIVEVPARVDRLVPRSDIAVLSVAPGQPEPKRSWAPDRWTLEQPDPRPPIAADQTVSVAGCERPAKRVQGEIQILDVATSGTNDVTLEGLSQTSIQAQPCAAGSPVVDSRGELVGMVAATRSPLAHFVPLEKLRAEIQLG